MEQTRGLSPEIVPVGIAQGRGLSPEEVSWQRYEPATFSAPLKVIGNIDLATVYLRLTPSAVEIYTPSSVTAYVDAATVRLNLIPSGIDIGPAAELILIESIPAYPPIGPPPVLVRWTVVHQNHDEYALGEVYPKNLDFALYLNRIGYCNYDIDMSHPLGRKEHTNPYETDFILYRQDEAIMGGEHTSINVGDVEAGVLSVAGQDWGHWIERQMWPFDPNDPLLYTYLETDRDIALVVKDILTQVLAFPDCLDLDLSFINAIGNNIDYKIEINDSEAIYNKITELAKRSPGFDFEITHDKRFLIYSPQKGSNIGISLVQGHNIFEVQYTNNGPTATYTLGTARSSSSQIGYIVQSDAPQFRRSMVNHEFSDITDENQLIDATEGEAARNVSPHRELTMKVVKEALDVWAVMRPGDTIHVDANLGYEHIDDDFRVVGMQCTPNDEGDEEWSLTVDDGTLSL